MISSVVQMTQAEIATDFHAENLLVVHQHLPQPPDHHHYSWAGVTLLLQVGGIESEQSLFALASTLPLEALFLIVLAHLWMSQRSHVRFLFTWFLPCAPAIHRGKIEEQAYSPVHRL